MSKIKMTNNEQKVQCQKCGESISIDDVLTRQIEEKIKKDFEATQKIREQAFARVSHFAADKDIGAGRGGRIII